VYIPPTMKKTAPKTAPKTAAKALAKNLLNFRKKNNVTQVVLAKKMGVPQSQMAYLESGDANPKLNVLVKVSKATGIDMGRLVR
jgi:transcriptional regulator with XRE-family HTH domain